MPRLAWFSPASTQLQSAGGALVRELSTRYVIDTYVDRDDPGGVYGPDALSAHDFVWRHRLDPYDLTVFEVADHRDYDFVWPYLVRHPGLVLLHDGRLHQSRAESLLRQLRREDYGAEFAFNHPDSAQDVPGLSIPQALGEARDLWPMRRVVVESSRWLVCPSPWLADEIRDDSSHTRIGVVEPGLPSPDETTDTPDVVRHRLGLSPDTVVFAAMVPQAAGGRLPEILTAFAAVARSTRSRLLLPGGARLDDELGALSRRLGLTPQVVTTAEAGELTDTERRTVADVCLCLQWPARSDGHWQWLGCLEAGRATVTVDLADRVHLPMLDPRDWRTRPVVPRDDATGPDAPPAAVAVDVVDEAHSLMLALRRLASDPGLRTLLGQNARRLARTRFGLDRMVTAMDDAIRHALATPLTDVSQRHLPEHLLADGTDRTRATLRNLGLDPPWPWLDPTG